MKSTLPVSVRYLKNGRKGQWWPAAKLNKQLHVGWSNIPTVFLMKPDYDKIGQLFKDQYGVKNGATQDFNALRDLLDNPSKHIWMTFEDGCMWWCTVLDGATVNPYGESPEKGNFWLACNRPWSNRTHRWCRGCCCLNSSSLVVGITTIELVLGFWSLLLISLAKTLASTVIKAATKSCDSLAAALKSEEIMLAAVDLNISAFNFFIFIRPSSTSVST